MRNFIFSGAKVNADREIVVWKSGNIHRVLNGRKSTNKKDEYRKKRNKNSNFLLSSTRKYAEQALICIRKCYSQGGGLSQVSSINRQFCNFSCVHVHEESYRHGKLACHTLTELSLRFLCSKRKVFVLYAFALFKSIWKILQDMQVISYRRLLCFRVYEQLRCGRNV